MKTIKVQLDLMAIATLLAGGSHTDATGPIAIELSIEKDEIDGKEFEDIFDDLRDCEEWL